jgi:peptidoglycan hydrolase-like protein with peptidoglycan-binding domain
MTKIKHVAFAGITALAFSQIAFAGGDMKNQPSASQDQPQQQQQSTAPGMDQSTIKQAQEKLSSKGHDVQADGVLGPKTQAALKEFQEKEGIQASGRLDQETLAALGVDEGSAGTGSSSPSSSTGSSSTSGTDSSSASGSSGNSGGSSGSSDPSQSEPKAEPKS